jgi:hypothetical protein
MWNPLLKAGPRARGSAPSLVDDMLAGRSKAMSIAMTLTLGKLAQMFHRS